MKHCVLCGTNKNSVKIAKNQRFGWNAMYCKKCKLGYSNEEDKKIKKAYEKFYKNEYWHTKYGQSKIYEQDFKNRMRMKLIKILRSLKLPPLIAITHYDMIDKHAPQGRFLEIGPGEGYSLRYFNKKYDIKAIEPDKINTENINRYFKKNVCTMGDIEKMTLKEKYDVVYLSHVFEHLISPLDFLINIRKNLNPKGIVFIEIPNCEYGEMMKISAAENETHIYHFTLDSVNALFRKAGYTVIESGVYANKTENPILQACRALFHMPSYASAPRKSGKKIVVMAKITNPKQKL